MKTKLIILDGARGAGKSTVSKELQKSLPKLVHLSIDEEREKLTEQTGDIKQRNNMAFDIMLEKARNFLSSNINVVTDCGIMYDRLNKLEKIAIDTGSTIHKFVLRVPYDELLNRVKGRKKDSNPINMVRFDEIYKLIYSKDFSDFIEIDTIKHSPEETSKIIINSFK